MNTNNDLMTPAQAAGYIVGVVLGFLRRHCRAFALLIAAIGLAVVLATVFRGGVLLGLLMMAFGAFIWLSAGPKARHVDAGR